VADTSNLYQQLKDALQQFKQFLEDPATTSTLHDAISALKPMVPQIGDLLDKLIGLMDQLHDAVNQIDVTNINGLQQVTQFTTGVTTLLQTAESLLPAEKPTIDEVLSAAGVVTQLPSLSDVKQQILDLLTGIKGDLQALNK
jgi:ABC-type transporter Mla subunit MlaD